MPIIGTFTAVKDGYAGTIRTLNLNSKVEILANDRSLRRVIITELEEVRKQFGDERRTEIIDEGIEYSIEDLIADDELKSQDDPVENTEQSQESVETPHHLKQAELRDIHDLAAQLIDRLGEVPDGDLVGEIVDTVSSASTELEASAKTLTSTAERGQEVATAVAAASEEASTDVQSVASATEALSSSLTEISRVIALAAQKRENSRGAHFRIDFPGEGDLATSRFTLARQRAGKLDLTDEPVQFTHVRPGETLLREAAE